MHMRLNNLCRIASEISNQNGSLFDVSESLEEEVVVEMVDIS